MSDEKSHKQSEDGHSEKQEAAQGGKGQEQEPKQAKEGSSTTWDTDQHSDAPGPFGTGDEE